MNMKKILAIISALTVILSLAGCKGGVSSGVQSDAVSAGGESSNIGSRSESAVGGSSSVNSAAGGKTTAGSRGQSGGGDYSENISDRITSENVKINSLDKLNFYAVKKAIAEGGPVLLSDTFAKPQATPLANYKRFGLLNLASPAVTDINPNQAFTITMYSYFTAAINDTSGFLAQKLGGTGSVEVVITRNSFNNMITFKKGERYYSCFQTSLTDKAMSFSSQKYVSGFKLIENYAEENYEYTVYFEGDKVIGINCGRFEGNGNYKYVADDIKLNGNLSFVIHKKQTFTAEQLESLFSSNNSFVDDGIVLKDGTVLFGESSVTDNAVAFKNGAGKTVITGGDIKKISAMHNQKFGFCIRLELKAGNKISGKTNLTFYLNNSKIRDLTLQADGSAVYITDLNNKSRLTDVFYKLTAPNTSNRIGRIIDHNDFVKEISKKINLNEYDLKEEDYTASFGDGLGLICYTYNLKTDKSISHKVSNYDITIDGITVTVPIKVSDLISKGFKVMEKSFDNGILAGSAIFHSPDGNEVTAYIMNFYGNSWDFNSCYATQISFRCYEETFKYQEGISPTRPDFEMIEGINKDSTIDDIISRLGEPNEIYLMTTDNKHMNYKDCNIQLHYKVYTSSLPNGDLTFNLQPVLNNTSPADFLTDLSLALQ